MLSNTQPSLQSARLLNGNCAWDIQPVRINAGTPLHNAPLCHRTCDIFNARDECRSSSQDGECMEVGSAHVELAGFVILQSLLSLCFGHL
jgi:hypothetical protein